MNAIDTARPGAGARLRSLAGTAGPPLLFGLRLSLAVSAALYVAFSLELDNPSWAGTSASIMCQPVLGASLRKGLFRLVGTVVGAIMAVLLTAVFPQDRAAFLLVMALWCGACSFVSTLLRNFAAYAAMLAGYTLVIIASSSIEAPDQVFPLALSRATEIAVGIVCGMAVMALTDAGRSGRRLADTMTGLVGEIGAGALSEIARAGAADAPFQARRRVLIKAVAGLDPLLDQTVGESAAAAIGRTTVRAGIQGLFLALSAWRTLGLSLADEGASAARHPGEALSAPLARLLAERPGPEAGAEAQLAFGQACASAAETCRAAPETTPEGRLDRDRLASLLEGLGAAANAVALLGGIGARPLRAVRRNVMPDILPPLVNGARVFTAVAAASLFWIATAWPQGLSFVTFLAVAVLIQSPRDESAFSAAVGSGLGMLLTALVAALIKFAVLPNHESFTSFAIVIGLALVPMAALSMLPSLGPVFVGATTNFIPLLGPANQITYDMTSFANTALGIVGGSVAGAVVMRVIPPVPPKLRASRLVALTLRDLRHLALKPERWRPDPWRTRIYGRLLVLPAEADLADGSRLLAALTVGLQLMELGAAAPRGDDRALLRAIGADLAGGRGEAARRGLMALHEAIQNWPVASEAVRLRLQGAAREISETLVTYADYIGAEIR